MGMNNMRFLPVIMALGACGFAEGPKDVAEQYWSAVAQADRDRAQSYATESTRNDVRVSDDELVLRRIVLTDVERDGDGATVTTEIEVDAGSLALDVEFETVLRKDGRRWRVVVDQTNAAIAAEVVQDVFGGSLEDLGATLGDVLGQAFDGMAEGLASGMAEAIGSLEQAFSYMAEAQSDAPDTVAGDWRNAPPGPTQGRSRDKRAEQSRAQPNPNR